MVLLYMGSLDRSRAFTHSARSGVIRRADRMSGRIGRPELRQIQRPVDEGMAATRGVGGIHADAAGDELARRTCALTLHIIGGLSLLEEGGFRKHRYRLRIG